VRENVTESIYEMGSVPNSVHVNIDWGSVRTEAMSNRQEVGERAYPWSWDSAGAPIGSQIIECIVPLHTFLTGTRSCSQMNGWTLMSTRSGGSEHCSTIIKTTDRVADKLSLGTIYGVPYLQIYSRPKSTSDYSFCLS
jgi:hypothetical protein